MLNDTNFVVQSENGVYKSQKELEELRRQRAPRSVSGGSDRAKFTEPRSIRRKSD